MTYAYRDYIFRRCTYVFYRRTCATDVRILLTYAIMDVRASTTYVFGNTLLENEIRDYAVEIEDSGLRRTFWIPDLDTFSGLSIASKNYN